MVFTFPMPFLYWVTFKEYIVTPESYTKNDVILSIVCSSIPVFNHICLLFILSDECEDGLKDYKNKLNEVRKCSECNISSRKWQFNNLDKEVCPHCNSKSRMWHTEEGDYPFAPKLNTMQTIKHILKENKLKKVKDEFNKMELYDDELKAYEELQMKKLKEFEEKADQIKQELNMK